MKDSKNVATSYSQLADHEIKTFIDHIATLVKLDIQHKRSHSDKHHKDYKRHTHFARKEFEMDSITKADIKKYSLEKFNWKSDASLIEQIDLKKKFAYASNRSFVQKLVKFSGVDKFTMSSKPLPNASYNRTLSLNLERIMCIKDTNELGKKDELAIGGVSFYDDTEKKKINELSLGKFKKGQEKHYNPPVVLSTHNVNFNLLSAQNSYLYWAIFTLAEKDSGGFEEYIHHLYNSITSIVGEVINEISILLSVATGTALGAAIGALGGPIGALLGAVVGLVAGALVGWISKSMKDDIFEPQHHHVQITTGAPFKAPVKRFTFKDFGGEYEADLFWQLS
ncbi:MAG: glycine zipper family protein [Psychroserpens sp.]|uniref:glycine zipper family protein n=1 Tax=Psychroserpens sp. TaxID=2020870 RepID=UPI003C7548FA